MECNLLIKGKEGNSQNNLKEIVVFRMKNTQESNTLMKINTTTLMDFFLKLQNRMFSTNEF